MLNKEELRKLRVTALKNKNTTLKNIISIVIGEIEGEEKKSGIIFSESQILEHVIKSLKAVKSNRKIYEERNDSAKVSQADEEIKEFEYIISLNSEYKPPLTDEEVLAMADELGVSSMKEMGKFMGHLKENHLGRYDATTVSALIKNKLMNK